jgi:hypothetical protein
MQICPNCKNENRPGLLFCENCGTPLMIESAATSLATRMLGDDPKSATESAPKSPAAPVFAPAPTSSVIPIQKPLPPESPSTEKIQKDATAPVPMPNFAGESIEIALGALLTFDVGEGAPPIEVVLKELLVFGRKDAPTGTLPDVDLSNLAGYRMGVSRKHAEIRYNSTDKSLELWDLGSSNGTFINGDRLVAHRAYRLNIGDQVRFGQLVLTLHLGSLANRPEAAQKKEEAPTVESASPPSPVTEPTAPPIP